MTDDDVERVARKRGSLGGFAPGGYMNTCLNCDEQFTGDKRAWSCFYCALATMPTQADAYRKAADVVREIAKEYAPGTGVSFERLAKRIEALAMEGGE